MKRYEAEMRHEIGIDKLMWGADYPHLEGAAPVHREILRYIFGGMPEDEVRKMLGRATPSTCGASTPRCSRRLRTGSGRPSPMWPAPGAFRHRGHVQLEPGPAGAAGRGELGVASINVAMRDRSG